MTSLTVGSKWFLPEYPTDIYMVEAFADSGLGPIVRYSVSSDPDNDLYDMTQKRFLEICIPAP